MAAKKTGQDLDSTSEKAADAAPGSVSQAAAVPPSAAALSQSGAAPASEQSGVPAESAVPAAPAAPSSGTATADETSSSLTLTGDGADSDLGGLLDHFRAGLSVSLLSTPPASALQDSALGAGELPGYLVTDVSSVLHDGTWYHQGDAIFLNDKDAAPLLSRRIIEPTRSEK